MKARVLPLVLALLVHGVVGWASQAPTTTGETGQAEQATDVTWQVHLDPATPSEVPLGARFDVWIEARLSLPIVPAGGDQLGAERAAREALRARFGTTPFGELDDGWVLVDVAPVVIQRLALEELQGGQLVARQRVRLIALEAGELRVPPLLLEADAEVELPTFTVHGYLGPVEDTARPPADLDEALADAWSLPEQPNQGDVIWPVAGSVGAVCGVLVVLALTRRRRTAQSIASTRPALLVLQDLAAHAKEQTGPALQAAHFELTALVRAAFDARESAAMGAATNATKDATLTGATDEEWLAQRSSAMTPDERDAWLVWFAECAEIKYGGGSATAWGLEARVKQALERLQSSSEVRS